MNIQYLTEVIILLPAAVIAVPLFQSLENEEAGTGAGLTPGSNNR